MTDPEGTPQETELEPESSTDEPESSTDEPESSTDEPESSTDEATVDASAFDVNPEAEKQGLQQAEEKKLTADYQIEGEKAGAADYQTRLDAFDNVETPVPVESLPVKTPGREESDEA